MRLSVGIRILLCKFSTSKSYDYAEKLLKCFVKGVFKHYGDEQLVYNVRNLIHLADDARKFGSLNLISCFPFENFLGQLKSVLRRPNNPHQSIIRHVEKVKANELCYNESDNMDVYFKCLHENTMRNSFQ